MRMVYCLLLLLPACTSHAVRCDGRLLPINLPAVGAAAGGAGGGASTVAVSACQGSRATRNDRNLGVAYGTARTAIITRSVRAVLPVSGCPRPLNGSSSNPTSPLIGPSGGYRHPNRHGAGNFRGTAEILSMGCASPNTSASRERACVRTPRWRARRLPKTHPRSGERWPSTVRPRARARR